MSLQKLFNSIALKYPFKRDLKIKRSLISYPKLN